MASEIVMYIIVNKDIRMSQGKLAAQVAHVAIKAFVRSSCLEASQKWYRGSYTKIILKASEHEIRQMQLIYPNCETTIDEGRTEIPKGTLTALAFYPMSKDEVPLMVKECKLL